MQRAKSVKLFIILCQGVLISGSDNRKHQRLEEVFGEVIP